MSILTDSVSVVNGRIEFNGEDSFRLYDGKGGVFGLENRDGDCIVANKTTTYIFECDVTGSDNTSNGHHKLTPGDAISMRKNWMRYPQDVAFAELTNFKYRELNDAEKEKEKDENNAEKQTTLKKFIDWLATNATYIIIGIVALIIIMVILSMYLKRAAPAAAQVIATPTPAAVV